MAKKESGFLMTLAVAVVALFIGLTLDSYLTPYLPVGWMGALIGFIIAALVIVLGLQQVGVRKKPGLLFSQTPSISALA